IVILGVGRDGHTASLFPEFPDLLKDTGLVIPVPIPNMEPKIERVSITFNLINASENILILTSKENKEKIINEIIMNNSMDYPVSLIKNKETLYWLISERN
ncbi:MAG: 6-phosphogluconolactonase, partial [uncultured bacterium]